jgi:hypothetical protein
LSIPWPVSIEETIVSAKDLRGEPFKTAEVFS